VLAKVRDAVKVLAGGVFGGQWAGALIVGQVAEGALVGLGEADHGVSQISSWMSLVVAWVGEGKAGGDLKSGRE
jgi:hypothetical protein